MTSHHRTGRPEIGTSVERALEVIGNGGLVALPTETVYGLAADADDERAVRSVFAAKGRPADHPLIVHVAEAAQLAEWASEIPDSAAILAETCWPGPLTLLVPRATRVLDVVTGGRPTVGVRVPAHPLATELLTRFRASGGSGGLAAPSANRFGRVSPTTAAHVAADLGDAVGYVLDGGPCPVGVESTIVDCTVEPAQVLRPGGISAEQVAEILGADGVATEASGPSRAPGMLASHYAPDAQVVLVASTDEAHRLAAATPGSVIVDHGQDLASYARSLYADLRAADLSGATTIIAVLPPAEGLGHAVRDRLAKAAHR
ncbi:MAG: L-threonylcarbamoyladenylate synthase [Ilumatobacteraceae bacterium]